LNAGSGFRVDVRDDSAFVAFCRGPANALDIGTLEALASAIPRLAQVRAVVFAGAPHFCAGVAIEDHVPSKIDKMLAAMHGFLRALLEIPAVTIAQVSGACLGGGAEIALACDFVLAAEDARIGFPEIGLACFPPAGAILLPGAIGFPAASDWLATGRTISGREAERAGFASRCASAAGLPAAVEKIVAEMSTRSAGALRELVAAMRAPKRRIFAESISAAEDAYRRLAASPELAAAVAAHAARKK
jgi:cyclohexa-1,5-dienecarbonyl-CoA hydratase